MFRFSVFVGHVYLQHARCAHYSNRGLRYLTYMIPAKYDLEDSVEIVYGARLSVRKRAVTGGKNKTFIRM